MEQPTVMPLCASCRCYFTPTFRRNGVAHKTCTRCREYSKTKNQKYKCEHGRQRHNCVECGGSGICEHKRRRSECIECGGSSICEHKRRRSDCIECGGSRICEHVHGLITQSNNQCYYCNVDIQYIEYNTTLATIERLDNSLGHIKGNCVIACRTCNFGRIGNASK